MVGRGLAVLIACVAVLGAATTARAAEYDLVPIEAKAADGIVLRGHAYLPKQAQRPLGTVLSYSPYFYGAGAENRGTDELADDSEVSFLLDAGFAYAAVNMRGTGHSDGCMGFGDPTDVSDAATVVQTIAAQPWSNGNVGMYGHSFPAWSQMMAMAGKPPALKAIVPTSGAFDLWSLLMRRGAPLNAEGSTAFGPIFTAATGHPPPDTINQACPSFADMYRAFSENSTTGDRTDFYKARDLRDRVTGSPVAMLGSFGIISGLNDGHILQFEGMWDRLRHDRTHEVLGQWSHEVPTDHKKDWHAQVIGWFDHWLRGGPDTVGPGVEYQDDDDRWHRADRWPPRSQPTLVKLSGDKVVPDTEKTGPVNATFQSADNDPGLRSDQPDDKTRLYNSTCGPHQALFVSRPLAENVLLAGNIDVDLDLTSTLPGGNLSVFFWRTKGDGSCPDQTATWWARALMDLRHWATPGQSKDFPVGTPTRVQLRSHPFSAVVHKGERIVIGVGGGSSELEPDPRHPAITITRGAFTLPVVTAETGETGETVPGAPPPAAPTGNLTFVAPSRRARACRSRRALTIHLPRGLARARVTTSAGRVRMLRGHRRLRARLDLRGVKRGVVRARIVGVTRSGRRVSLTRRYRTGTRRRR